LRRRQVRGIQLSEELVRPVKEIFFISRDGPLGLAEDDLLVSDERAAGVEVVELCVRNDYVATEVVHVDETVELVDEIPELHILQQEEL